MSRKKIVILSTAGSVLLGVLFLLIWFFAPIPQKIELRVPEKEDEPEKAVIEQVDIRGSFQKFSGVPSGIRASWPRFRGTYFDNINKEKIKINDQWGKNGPPLLWAVELGEGYAGPAVHNGCVYIMDYDEAGGSDSLRCFSLDNGQEIWRRSYKVHVKRNHGMSRTVPAVTDQFAVTMGPKCHVLCADARTGAFLWGLDLARDFNTKIPLWYTGQCPLIDNSIAVLAPGGKSLLIGVDCATGRILWETPNPKAWQMSHSSVIPMTFYGRKFYVYCAIGGMAGVAADGPERGKVLWQTEQWNHSVIAPSPVQIAGNRIFITAGYGVGSMMLQVEKNKNSFSVKPLYTLTREVFACEQHTPIYYDDLLFSVMPNDAGALRRQLVCFHPDGRMVWASGKEEQFGLGPYLIADDKIFILDDKGILTLAAAGPGDYIRLCRAKVLNGRDSWAPMALVNGRLLLRDSKKLICLDLRKK